MAQTSGGQKSSGQKSNDEKRSGEKRVGYAGGAFDLFHVGHLNILRHARSNCDYLIAGVVSDEVLAATKGARPVVPLAERLEIVSHIDFVDEVIAETDIDKLATWRRRPFDIYFKGDDWKGSERGIRLEKAFATVGVEVVYFPYTVATSSTVLRRALQALSPVKEEPGSKNTDEYGANAERNRQA